MSWRRRGTWAPAPSACWGAVRGTPAGDAPTAGPSPIAVTAPVAQPGASHHPKASPQPTPARCYRRRGLKIRGLVATAFLVVVEAISIVAYVRER